MEVAGVEWFVVTVAHEARGFQVRCVVSRQFDVAPRRESLPVTVDSIAAAAAVGVQQVVAAVHEGWVLEAGCVEPR